MKMMGKIQYSSFIIVHLQNGSSHEDEVKGPTMSEAEPEIWSWLMRYFLAPDEATASSFSTIRDGIISDAQSCTTRVCTFGAI